MGIKWREGLLQIKGRCNEPNPSQFGPLHEGIVEHWIKWSFAGLPEAYRQLFDAGAGDGRQLVAVRKRRLLRLLDTSDESGIVEVAPGQVVEHGIVIELTELEVGEDAYCSLGFEAFPDDTITQHGFNSAVAGFLTDLRATRLSRSESLSYPAWLAGLDLQA